MIVVGFAIRSQHEPVVRDLLLLFLYGPLFTRDNGPGEAGERVAFAGDLKRFVPPERSPLDHEPFRFQACLKGVECGDGSFR